MNDSIKHLYIHVPFCKTICSYCDFCHVLYKEELVDKWLIRIKKDLLEMKNKSFKTIYIGGGTPSSLNYNQLKELLSLIKPFSNEVIEYTIELNPESIDRNKIRLLKEYGINRVSIGLQSSNARLLKLMNRHHNYEDVKRVVSNLKDEGINNISIDVIYSLPTQSMDDLKKTIDGVLELDVPHISLYSLTIEKNTIFDKLNYKNLDEETEADMYEYIEKTLVDNNYFHYEIANFAKEGYESKHNLGYWNYDDYIGISSGAVGKYNHQRFTYSSNVKDYIEGKDVVEIEELDLKEEAFENIMMSLRTIYGLDLRLFKERYGIDFINEYKEALAKNKDTLIIKDNHCICLYREILNNILLDFMN